MYLKHAGRWYKHYRDTRWVSTTLAKIPEVGDRCLTALGRLYIRKGPQEIAEYVPASEIRSRLLDLDLDLPEQTLERLLRARNREEGVELLCLVLKHLGYAEIVKIVEELPDVAKAGKLGPCIPALLQRPGT